MKIKTSLIGKIIFTFGIIIIIFGIGLKINSKESEKKALLNMEKKIQLKSTRDNIKVENNNIKIENGEDIAIIEIPSIKLKSTIVEGAGKDEIKYKIGHIENTSMPGDVGNFCIAGHSSYIYSEILNKLYKVNTKDTIEIKTDKKTFIYKITKKFIVDPKSTWVLKQNKDQREITIVTCIKNGEKRLIVKGELT